VASSPKKVQLNIAYRQSYIAVKYKAPKGTKPLRGYAKVSFQKPLLITPPRRLEIRLLGYLGPGEIYAKLRAKGGICQQKEGPAI